MSRNDYDAQTQALLEASLKAFQIFLSGDTEQVVVHNRTFAGCGWQEDLIRRGLLYFEGRKLAQAEQCFRSALKQGQRHAEAYLYLGYVLHETKPREAEDCYEKAIEAGLTVPSAHVNLGSLLFARGEQELAEKHFTRAIEVDPYSADAHGNLAKVLMERRQFALAAEHFEETLRLQPTDFIARDHLAGLYYLRGDVVLAQRHWELVLRAKPTYKFTLLNLGSLYHARRDLALAEEYYEKALDADRSFAPALFKLGQLHLERNKQKTAEDFFLKTIGVDPRHAHAYNSLGVLAAARGEIASAEYYYQRAIDSDPQLPGPHNNRAYLLTRQSRFGEALRHFVQADRLVILVMSRDSYLGKTNTPAVGIPLVAAAACASGLLLHSQAMQHLRDAIPRCNAALSLLPTDSHGEVPLRWAHWLRHRAHVRRQCLFLSLPFANNLPEILAYPTEHEAWVIAVARKETDGRLLLFGELVRDTLHDSGATSCVQEAGAWLKPLLMDLRLAEHCEQAAGTEPLVSRVESANALCMWAAEDGGERAFVYSVLALAMSVDVLLRSMEAASQKSITDVVHAAMDCTRIAVAQASWCARFGTSEGREILLSLLRGLLDETLEKLPADHPASAGIRGIHLGLRVEEVREGRRDHASIAALAHAHQSALDAVKRNFAALYAGLQSPHHLLWKASADGVFRLIVEATLLLHVPDARAVDLAIGRWTPVSEEHSTALADALLAIRRINERALRAGGSAHASSTDLGETEEGGPMMDVPSNGIAAADPHVFLLCGTEHLVRIVMVGDEVQIALCRSTLVQETGRMRLEADWIRAHERYRRETQTPGPGPTAGDTSVATQPHVADAPTLPLDACQMLFEDLEPHPQGCTLSVDSVLVDLPMHAIGALIDFPVRAMSLERPSASAIADNPEVLVLISDQILNRYERLERTWGRRKVPSLLSAFAPERLHILRVGDSEAPREPCWVRPNGVPTAPPRKLLQPDIIFWLTHGSTHPSTSGALVSKLAIDGQRWLTPELLMEGEGRFVLPGEPEVEVQIPEGCRFVSGACTTGKIDTQMPSTEAVGLVRALFAVGVAEAFCPAYDIVLDPVLHDEGIETSIEFLLERLGAGLCDGRSLQETLPAAVDALRNLRHKGQAIPRNHWAYANLWIK